MVIYGGSARARWTAELEGANVPVFSTTREAARALSLMVQATARADVVSDQRLLAQHAISANAVRA